jgi:hypothetical protein
MKYIFASIALLLCLLPAEAQRRASLGQRHRPSQAYLKKKDKEKRNPGAPMPFADSQVWLGLKGGVNTTRALPTERYAVFVSTQGEAANAAFQKEYESFGQVNFQFGVVASYNFAQYLSVSFQPTYSNMYFAYRNQYRWFGQGNNNVELNQTHRYQLTYLEAPLLVRFDILRRRFRPYVQGGAFYGRLIGAEKFITTTSVDKASGAVNPLENTSPNIGARDLFIRSNWGWMGGLGLSYDVGNVRIGLEGLYRFGQNNITNQRNRYTDDRLTSVGDVADNLRLRNIECYFTVVFPMKFLQKSGFDKVNP